MSSTVHEIPPEVLTLLQLPATRDLSRDQVRGARCVWGKELLDGGTAIPLCERVEHSVRQFLRACPRCTGVAALRALHDHAPKCEQCVDDAARCPLGLGLRRVMREARR